MQWEHFGSKINMKLLRRYILREHIGPFVAALSVLTGLMLLNQLAKRFGDLVGKGLPWYLIAEVFGLSIPFILAMTMPMAVLVAVLYTFSRLSGDNEITAMKAGGVSLVRLLVPVLVASGVLAGGMIVFNDRVLPESNHELRKLLSDIGRKQPTFELRERVINEVVDGALFLQAGRIDRSRSLLYDLVIFDLGRPDVSRTIYADSGHMAFNETQTDLYLTLYDGSMLERDTDDPRTDQRTYYASQVIRVPGVTNELERGRSSDFRGDREMSIAMMREEIQERRARMAEYEDSVAALVPRLAPVRTPRSRPDRPGRRIPLDAGGEMPEGEADYASEGEADDAMEPGALDAVKPRVADSMKLLSAQAVKPLASEPDAAAKRKVAEIEIPTLEFPGRPSPTIRPPETGRPASTRLEKIRQLQRNRATDWPPAGDAVQFAAEVRSQLDRLVSRHELQRREVARYAVEIEKKFAIPIAAVIFVLIGAPIGIRFPRGGVGMVIGVSLSVFCVYYVFLIGGEEFADRDFLSPFWAMWAPNVLFGAAGCAILYVVSREGTSRMAAVKRRVRGWLRAFRLSKSARSPAREVS